MSTKQLKRVVITGIGIVSSIGNNREEVLDALMHAKSGIKFSEEYQTLNFRSHVYGPINIKPEEHIERQHLRFMGDAASFAYIAMKEAIKDAELPSELLSHEKTGLIVGSGGASNKDILESAELLKQGSTKKIGPFRVPRTMGSTTSACLATCYGIKGRTFSISSACATSAHCIGTAYELIQTGKQNIMFAGGGEELHWSLSMLFDAMGALSSKYNSTPHLASRPFDTERDGFIISGGGGIVVLEELAHAKARNAPIYAEIVGYGATSDGYSMVQPSGEGAIRCMREALSTVNRPVDYINAHATSTTIGDLKEAEAILAVFPENESPAISGTKSLTGHSLGAAGAQELIYTILMLQHNFVAPTINLNTAIPEVKNLKIIVDKAHKMNIDVAMSNNFGFGGVNTAIVIEKIKA